MIGTGYYFGRDNVDTADGSAFALSITERGSAKLCFLGTVGRALRRRFTKNGERDVACGDRIRDEKKAGYDAGCGFVED